MINPDQGNFSPNLRDSLLKLNALVPKNSQVNAAEKGSLQDKVREVLQQVLENPASFEAEQQNNLMNIRDLAKKAEKLGLLSESSKTLMSEIAAVAKEKGLSLYTAPRDLTIKTKNGDILVNSDVLKASSEMFDRMFQTGMKEQREKVLDLNKYSKETVELLIRYLHAPKAAPIALPKDNAQVLELIDLAMTYKLDGLIQKLEPAVSQFIAEQPQAVLKNTEAWMQFLVPQKDQKYQAAAVRWIADLTPHFLNNFDLPVVPSALQGRFEIPIEQRDCLFDENTRGLFQHLPLVLEIKNGQDLALFEKACAEYMGDEHLSIKLLCKQGLAAADEARLKTIAGASNIEITLEKLPIPPGTTLFGKEEWETYFGPIGEAPPIPAGIAEILSSPCPYFPGQTYKDTFMLTLIPATVNGKPLHLNHLGDLIQTPTGGGHGTSYDYVHQSVIDEHGTTAPNRSYWALMSMRELSGSREKSYQEQQALVAANPGYEVPDLLSAAVCILTHFVRTGVRLFPRDPWTYTRCQETIAIGQNRYQTIAGGFGVPGLPLNYSSFDNSNVAVAALRKFF